MGIVAIRAVDQRVDIVLTSHLKGYYLVFQ